MAPQAVVGETWIRRFHPKPGAAVRLVCFPHAGGSAGYFHPLSALLGPEVEVLAVQYPGRQDRRIEPAVADIGELADEVAGALRPWADQPLALFGHSMGALVAFETARRLERRGGAALSAFFASGRRAPSRYREEHVHRLDDAGLVAAIRALNGTDHRLLDDEEILRVILPAVRSDYRAAETYRCPPDAVLADLPITALLGDRDPRVTPEEAHAWREHTTGPFELRVFPGGGHFYLADARAELALLLTERLTAAERGASRTTWAGGSRAASRRSVGRGRPAR
ncbi:thioesterase II family protein [Kitasatospora sp. NPDC052896]|uniref:thioesterase II family protein n=1 Tax=Kitasatospora sp. NPDC052896 TaxID=3364061 RepID=UPI0037C94BCA